MPSNTARIAKNTLLLYFRQILIMLVSLYTVRVVLETLGAEDYGIYNVVAGVVTMFGFLSGSMASASQRYFSFEIGRGDFEQLKKTFSLSFLIYVLIAVLVLLLAETVGLWFVNNKLVMPPERMDAARWVYQFSILSFLFTVLTTPYMAAIIAHEDMNIYAYMSIAETALKLGIVFLLRFILMDKLQLYGILLCAVTLLNTMIYRTICKVKYRECVFTFYWNKDLFKEIISYTGWNLFGSFAWLIRTQGIQIVLNLFFGPLVNAARSIASQVNNAVSSFTSNFSTAMYPHIVKSYTAKDAEYVWCLLIRSSKICYFLFLFISMPLLLETEFILAFWLQKVPEYACLFTRLIIIDALITSFTYVIGALSHATGNIKVYQLVIGSFLILNLPVSMLSFYIGSGPEAAMFISIIFSFFALLFRLVILKKQINFPIYRYIKEVLGIATIVTCIAVIFPFFLRLRMEDAVIRFFLVCFSSVICCALSIYFIGLNNSEKKQVKTMIVRKFKVIV
ncbi:hypothetical protein FACS189450_13450 [Spirochaetia bacterium]|nr:hypothetical protein FACS189450_13450 [Spirochaetia bacterium]